MNKLFTKIAALALGATMAVGVGVAVGTSGKAAEPVHAANYSETFDYSDLEDCLDGDYVDASSYWKVPETAGNSATITLDLGGTYSPTSNITVTFKIATFGGGNNPSSSNTTISVTGYNGSSSTDWTKTGVSSYPSSSTYVNAEASMTLQASTPITKLIATMGVNTGVKIFRLQSVSIAFSHNGGSGPTLESISVNTAPTKTSYTEGEFFNPAGLVISRTYSNPASTDTYTYADHTSEFTFSPNLTTALTTSNTSVTISYGGKSVSQAITVSAAASRYFQKITSAAGLEDGASYLIANSNGSKVMAGQGNSNRLEVAATVSDGRITYSNTMELFTLHADSQNWTFEATKLNTGYLYASSSSSNQLKTQATVNDNGRWAITYSSGTPSIVAQGTNSRNVMQYNSGSSLFACYGSASQAAVSLWKEANSGLQDLQITYTSSSDVDLVIGGTASSQIAGVNVNGCTYATGDSNVATVSSTGLIEAVHTGTTTITISHEDDATYHYLSATVNVTVTKIYDYTTSFSTTSFATAKAAAVAAGADVEVGPYFLVGHIKSISNTTYGNGVLANTNEAEDVAIFNMYDVDGKRGSNMANPAEPVADDVVVLQGKVLMYGGNTFEIKNAIVRQLNGTVYKVLESISVKTAPTKTTYNAGETFDPTGLVITLTYDDSTTEDISYASHSADFTFSPTTSTALSTSDNKVTITYKEKNVDQAITVNTAPAVLSVTVNPSSTSVDINDTTTLTASVSAEGGASQDVTWSSSDDNIATVDATGVVTGVAKGTVTITAESVFDSSKKGTASVKVTDPNDITYTWDLTAASYSSHDASDVVWSTTGVSAINHKASGSTAADNYIPQAGSDNDHSRILYTGHTFSIVPAASYVVSLVEITFTTNGYASTCAGLSWTNATATSNDAVVTIIPTDGSVTFSANGTSALRAIQIYVEYQHTNTKVLDITDSSLTVAVNSSATTTLIETNYTGGSYTADTNACAIVSISGTTVTVTGKNAGSYTFTITESTYSLTVTLTVNVYDPSLYYGRVNSDSDLIPGDRYVIGSNGTNNLMGGVTSSYMSTVDGTSAFRNEKANVDGSALPSGTQIVTFIGAGQSGKYYIYSITSEAFFVGSDSSVSLKPNGTLATASVWTVSISGGVATISLATREFLHNNNSPRFGTYEFGGGYSRPVLYHMSGSDLKTNLNTFQNDSLKMNSYDVGGTHGSTGGDGSCKSYYLPAKQAFNALEEAEQQLFKTSSEYLPAKTRYEDWAVANNDGAPYDGNDSIVTPITSSRIVSAITSESTNTIAIIVIISIISVSAIGGYFFLRKRREEN